MPTENPISWRPNSDMSEWLEGRASRSAQPGGLSARTRTEMRLWRSCIHHELLRLRFSLNDLAIIASALNGTIIPDAVSKTVPIVAAKVIEHLRVSAEGRPVQMHSGDDHQGLVTYLLSLGPTADHALGDAITRWQQNDHDHTPDGWAAVGITVRD